MNDIDALAPGHHIAGMQAGQAARHSRVFILDDPADIIEAREGRVVPLTIRIECMAVAKIFLVLRVAHVGHKSSERPTAIGEGDVRASGYLIPSLPLERKVRVLGHWQLVGRHVPSWEYEVRYFLHFLIWGGRPNCELARNNDPLRGVFSRPIATPLTFRQCSLPLASVGREGLEGMMAVDKIG